MTDESRQLRCRPGFTLNELLIVIAIIVLMLGLAVPAFNALTGSKSVEGATNQISAVLGQARVEAIGVQEIRGVMFFIEPKSGRINIAMVRATAAEPSDTINVTYLDLVPDRDFTALPAVGIQTIDNATIAANLRTDDGYIGYNTGLTSIVGASSITPAVQFGGVILFDAYGKLVSQQYGFRCSQSTSGAAGTMTAMASLLSVGDLSAVGTGSVKDCVVKGTTFSQIGIAAYPNESFNSANYTLGDPQIDSSMAAYTVSTASQPSEQAEETWLDTNASLYLVNRYNGTLVKGE